MTTINSNTFSANTISTAATVNVTEKQLTRIAKRYEWADMTKRQINADMRTEVEKFAPAAGVEELPTIGYRGARTKAAYSGVAGGKDVPVFLGKRVIVAAGVLHADGSLTTNGETFGSPSAAQTAVAKARGKATPRVSGWARWLYVDSTGNVRPIEAIREGGVEQSRSNTTSSRVIERKRFVELKKTAKREAATKIGHEGTWV